MDTVLKVYRTFELSAAVIMILVHSQLFYIEETFYPIYSLQYWLSA